MSETTTTAVDSIKSLYESMKSMKEEMVAIIICIMIVFLLISIFVYGYYMKNLKKSECKKMDTLYANAKTFIQNLNFADPDCQFTLKDYYIKTAYNCCCGGSYKNDFVDTCILKDVLKQGVRGLDFEIYSLNDEPVIACSTVDNYFIKETYNSVPFADAMTMIVNNGFSASTAPNPQDPIILHLRIKSTNQKMFDKLAAIFNTYDYLTLGPEYSFEYTQCNMVEEKKQQCYSKNLGDVPLSELKGKIVIIVDRSNTAVSDNQSLYEFVNMTSNSLFMRLLNYYDVKFTPDMNELITYNKKAMTLCIPDKGNNPENPSGVVTREMGCQMMAMRYNYVDQYLEESDAFFDTAGYAFALKPERLRYQVITIEATPPNDPLMDFAPRTIKTDYYNFNT